MNPESDNQPVALSGHMDTVHPVVLFGTPAVRRENEKIYGPGVMDCKGGIVAGFLAMDALQICGFKERPVMMLLQSNEEIGSDLDSKEPINYICKKAADVVAVLNLEGHGEFDNINCLVRKGIAVFEFKVKGIAAHSSLCARRGASAITDAAHKVIELEKLKDDSGVTCNCGVISGGTVSNSVAAECRFNADVRFSTQEQYKTSLEYLQKISDTVYVDGCTCEMVQTALRPAMELTDKNMKLFEKTNEIFEKNGLSRLEIGKGHGGSDAADATCYGIPCMDAIGVSGGCIHSVDEYANISSLAEAAKRVACIICGI